ncbi:helix-turn-helix domain-containing protein [Stutzerimonas nitrititolerans]|uniref:helix-turn-helix domain-containing protein n=1 Tax=Stutzerimonas nitrititolerans TaxID=2482751 RepID=UPI0028AF0FCE|nr:helix-turn-helix domain-containing protein [Stutzerimonas nitrititolerans]
MIYRVELDVPVRRLRCPVCGLTRERIDWLPGRSSVTTTLRQWVERLVTLLPIRHVADLVDLHWHTVKTIDEQRLQRDLPAPDPAVGCQCAIDHGVSAQGPAQDPMVC